MAKNTLLSLTIATFIFIAPLAAPAVSQAKELQIAMVLWRGETTAEKGFKDELAKLGYEVSYQVFDAKKDKGNLGKLLRKDLAAELQNFDYVYTFGTTVSKATHGFLKGQIPHIFNIVADPVKAELVNNLIGSSGNIAGVTNASPEKMQLQNAGKIIGLKTLGVLFNPQEKNSVILKNKIEEAANGLGIKVVELRTAPEMSAVEALIEQITSGAKPVDAVYLSNDAFLISNADSIGNKLTAAGIKSIGSVEKQVKSGILLGTVADYTKLGQLAAQIVDQNQQGQALATIPVRYDEDPQLIINDKTAKGLGIQVPDAVLHQAIVAN